MSGFWYQPERPAYFTAAGGEATLGEIYQAARDASLYVDNTIAAQAALERAYDDRNKQIFDLTGEALFNPYRRGWQGVDEQIRARERGDWEGPLQSAVSEWKGAVRGLAQRRPELAAQLMPARTIEDEALSITRDAEERFTRLSGSRTGAGALLAAFAGGGVGAVRDPVQVATLAVGGGPGAARTVAGRILATAFSEAAVNAGVELALQPIVQSYRAKAGLESGVDVALRNAAFAGLLGGMFGAGARGLTEVLTRGGAAEGRALANAVDDLPPAMRGEIERGLPQAASDVRQALPLPARGALDQVEMIGHLDETRPATALPEIHDTSVSRAHQVLDELQSPSDEPFPGFSPDDAQIMRISDALVGPASEGPKVRSLVGFLIDRGGIADNQGELRAIGADTVSERGRGRLVRADAATLDAAREAAEEAGYLGRAGETQTTTVADLLSAIDGELRGNPVYARQDLEVVAGRADIEAERVRVENAVAAVARHAGPGVDDAIVREAAEISLRDGVDAFDALEQVFVRAEASTISKSGTVSLNRVDHGDMGLPEPKAGLDDRAYAIERNGEAIAFANIRVSGTTAEVRDIFSVMAETRGVLGPSAMRQVLKQFIRDNPQIKTLVGERVSGARFGGEHFFAGSGVDFQMDVSGLGVPPGRNAEPMPGWSDDELAAASAARGAEPFPENGSPFDDPGRPAQELIELETRLAEGAEDDLIPGEGGAVPLSSLLEEIRASEDLAATVKACRA